ncbi:MAG: hypothetical protein RL417_2219 [Pseudomonadota bacterium]|jgi:pyrroloquinoline-quinone synthase
MESAQSSHAKNFSTSLLEEIAPKGMLNHPFYRAWEMGELPREVLTTYSKQYYHHVNAFPRYISATHSCCTDIAHRQVLLENLIDEEHGAKNHPALWLQFAEGMGATKADAEGETLRAETKSLIDTFMRLAQSSYAEGLGALFAYEQQIPAVAATKAEGLRKFYNAGDPRTVEYFTLHAEIDVHHSEATRKLIDALPAEDRSKALRAAHEVSEALWSFLDGMEAERVNLH